METTLEDAEKGRSRLTVDVPWDEIRADYDDVLGPFRQRRIPGFRPGKAPDDLILRTCQGEIEETLVRRCGERLGRQTLEERGVIPVGGLSIVRREMAVGEALRFTAEFVALPEMELPDVRAIPLPEDEAQWLDQVSDWLLAQVSVEAPEALVERELSYGADDDVTSAAVAREAAVQRVRLMIALRRIALAEGIEVDPCDLDQRIEEMAEQYGLRPGELRRDLAQGGGLVRLRDMLLAEQTLEYLVQTNAPASSGSADPGETP